MTETEQIVLIGFMGAGKTSIGRILAGLRGVPFHDLDVRIEESAELTIAEIFEEEGEPAFRRREMETLSGWMRDEEGVLATGGGVVESPACRELLARHRPVLWFDDPVDVFRDRLQTEGLNVRPLVGRLGPSGLARLHQRRRPLYAHCADFRLETAGRRPVQVARGILRLLAPREETEA